MRVSKRLLVGANAAPHRDSIIWRMKKGKKQKDLFVMTLAANPVNLLEMYPEDAVVQPYFLQSDLVVIGLAIGKGEADELIRSTIEKIYGETGGLNVRAYFGEEETAREELE